MNLFWTCDNYDDVAENEESIEKIRLMYKDDVAEYKEERRKIKSNNLKFLLRFNRKQLSRKDYREFVFRKIEMFAHAGLKSSDLVVSYAGYNTRRVLSKQELNNLKTLTDMLKPIGVEVGIFDYKDVFSYDEVKNATDIIKKNVYLVNKQNYSPLEKLIRAYLIVTNREYKEEPMLISRSTSMSRSVYGLLNSEYIVCEGYAKYLKAIIDECKDPNLAVFENAVAKLQVAEIEELKKLAAQNDLANLKKWLNQKNLNSAFRLIGPHQTNLVYIKDDKYKIDGFYYLDPTEDSICSTMSYEPKDLTDFLLGISQIKDFRWEVADYNSSCGYSNELDKLLDNVLKEPTPNTRIKYRGNDIKYYEYFNNTSVSNDGAAFDFDEINDSYVEDRYKVDTLYTFLQKRQDFRDFVTFKQTEKDLKNKRIKQKLGFDEIISKNYKNSGEDIKKNDVIFDSKAMFEYLEKHSSCVDVGQVNSALNVVLKNMYKDKTKDEISKELYDSYQLVLDGRKWLFEKPNSTTDSQSEEPVK